MSEIEWVLASWIGVLTVLVLVLGSIAAGQNSRRDQRVSTLEARLTTLERGQDKLLAGLDHVSQQIAALATARQTEQIVANAVGPAVEAALSRRKKPRGDGPTVQIGRVGAKRDAYVGSTHTETENTAERDLRRAQTRYLDREGDEEHE